jgi:hypothetical protein
MQAMFICAELPCRCLNTGTLVIMLLGSPCKQCPNGNSPIENTSQAGDNVSDVHPQIQV